MGERAREVHPDLHPMTYFILTHLANDGPMRGADLSDAFGMDKGGVSRQVQALVDLGLVERQPDPEDRRAILLDATDEGRSAAGHGQPSSAATGSTSGSPAGATPSCRTSRRQLAAYNQSLSDD